MSVLCSTMLLIWSVSGLIATAWMMKNLPLQKKQYTADEVMEMFKYTFPLVNLFGIISDLFNGNK